MVWLAGEEERVPSAVYSAQQITVTLRALSASPYHKISVLLTQENIPLQKCHVLLRSSLKKLDHLATGLCSPIPRDASTAILLSM